MSKRFYWLLALALVIVLAVIICRQVVWPRGPKAKEPQSGGRAGEDCEKAQFSFACYLDKAMAANNPDLCYDAGRAKRLNCLRAYTEIKRAAIDIDCAGLGNPEFRAECQAAWPAGKR